MNRPSHIALSLLAALVLAACGGGDDGNTTTPPPVTVQAPAITTGPASSSVTSGATATLSVAATGDSLTYQWRLDGVNIAGATAATYTTPALSVADSGKPYSVVVSNSAGSVTSTAAVLTVNPAAAAAVALTQQSANQLVADVNAGVAQLQQANLIEGLLPFGAQITVLPIGAVQTLPLEYCNTGSATMTLTTNDTTGQPVSGQLSFNNCNYAFGGFSASINGGATATVTSWTNETNFTIRLAYDIAYSFTGPEGSESGTYAGQQTCTFVNDVDSCTSTVGNNSVSDATVRTAGSITTVDTGRIANDQIDCVYNGWVYDSSAGRATSGSVTVTAPNGDRAVLTATTTGYTVVITVGGVSQTFTVAFPA